MRNRAIWLFGENRGETMSNNSWFAFRHLIMQGRELPVDAYFALLRTADAERQVAELPKRLRRRILWHSGARHREVFGSADRFFITLAYGDIAPKQAQGRALRRVPLVHLQHGTIGLKAVGYRGDSYDGTIDAFCTYNAEERSLLREYNGFADGQLYDAGYHPRYAELLQRADAAHGSREILWFLTWRDYLSPEHMDDVLPETASADDLVEHGERRFADSIARTIADPAVQQMLRREGRTLRLVFHQFYRQDFVDELADELESDAVRIDHGSDVDVMDAIARAELLITDYSSLAYDVTFLGRPVCLYQFDVEEYLAFRTAYVDLREVFTDHVAHEPGELAAVIEAAEGTVHPYYAPRVPTVADARTRAWVRDGGAIERLLHDMAARDVLADATAAPVAAEPVLLADKGIRVPSSDRWSVSLQASEHAPGRQVSLDAWKHAGAARELRDPTAGA